MTIRDLYEILDNVTMRTRFYIINSEGNILEWGGIYRELSSEYYSLHIEHCKYNDGEITVWVP